MSDFWDGVGGVVGDLAPTIASALGGPLAGKAAGMIMKAVGLPPSSDAETLSNAIRQATPEQQIAIKQAETEFLGSLVQAAVDMDAAQSDVNKVEANSAQWWVAGWRPFIGWVCGATLAWNELVAPLVFSVVQIWMPDVQPIQLDSTAMFTVLTGMLGIAGMRSLEKIQGVAGGEIVSLPSK